MKAAEKNAVMAKFLANEVQLLVATTVIEVGVDVANASLMVIEHAERLGLSPTYKWAKVHLGYRTMQFSKYSLSDITFFGVGVEINPGNLRMAAMYGELKTPNFNLDTLAFHADLISNYKRKAHGYKLGFGKQRNYFDLFYFKAKDRYDVADAEEFYITLLPPPENVVIGFDTISA